jgi:hypothetical protein
MITMVQPTYNLFEGAGTEVAVAPEPNVLVPPGYNMDCLPAFTVGATVKQAMSDVAETLYRPLTAEFPAESETTTVHAWISQ